ncbi:GSCFA domain-containing protein [Phytohabitans houttuyneae]|uniref:GSCFA domain-containing protein n=1 Tax=Phytohabitans houttuyneae TaxID=1076126 RepID=A0A6V8K6U5_9ACTN|nr:GSCFA domain-containing protein [Phytohabitans houttuyneae]GFJ78028.1 hypothetical protein Phou_022080 [Phytohabitans houttuyneae]
MALLRLTADDAFRRLAENPAAYWYDDEPYPHPPAGVRLRERIPRLTIPADFHLRRDDPVFCIGSCFARNIEYALDAGGYPVLSLGREFAGERMPDGEVGRPDHVTNKYHTHSMVQAIEWALDPAAQFPDAGLVRLDGGLVVDPHAHHALELVDLDGTLRRRRQHDTLTARIARARVVVVTLGLVEVWRDQLTGYYLNGAPTAQMRELHPDRYQFEVTDYGENLRNLERIYELLHPAGGTGGPDIVVTVSPVTMRCTFTGRDVIVANTYSKAVLRAVAEAWAFRHPDVHYFPSYELVTGADPEFSRLPDGSHVTRAMVDTVVQVFTETYLRGA